MQHLVHFARRMEITAYHVDERESHAHAWRKTIPFVEKAAYWRAVHGLCAHDQRQNQEPKMQPDIITRRLNGRSESIRHGTAHASSLLEQKLAFAREVQRRTRFRLAGFLMRPLFCK
jgi:hypothetical protein